jgi:uncharacterized protein (DUF2147 family)
MKYLITIATLFAASHAAANEPFGIWQTITDDTGAHLLVDVQPCATDSAKLCGTVSQVVNSPAPEAQQLVGRAIFWDLELATENNWANGQVYDVLTDTVYDSKVILGKTALRVEGCVASFCDGQNWKRPQQ